MLWGVTLAASSCFPAPTPGATPAEPSTELEQQTWGQHFAWLQELFAAEQLILVGVTLGRVNTGVAILEAADEDSARDIVAADPVTQAGLAEADLRPFNLALMRATPPSARPPPVEAVVTGTARPGRRGVARQSLQLAQAAISETDRRARQKLPGCRRGVDLAGLSEVYDPRRNVHRRAADVAALQLDLAGMDCGPDLQADVAVARLIS